MLLDAFSLAENDLHRAFAFECPPHDVLALAFRVDAGSDAVDVERIRRTWNANYSVSLRVSTPDGAELHNRRYDSSAGNIYVGGNWFSPDVCIILGNGSFWTFLVPGQRYEVDLSVTGEGLEETRLDFFLIRVYFEP